MKQKTLWEKVKDWNREREITSNVTKILNNLDNVEIEEVQKYLVPNADFIKIKLPDLISEIDLRDVYINDAMSLENKTKTVILLTKCGAKFNLLYNPSLMPYYPPDPNLISKLILKILSDDTIPIDIKNSIHLPINICSSKQIAELVNNGISIHHKVTCYNQHVSILDYATKLGLHELLVSILKKNFVNQWSNQNLKDFIVTAIQMDKEKIPDYQTAVIYTVKLITTICKPQFLQYLIDSKVDITASRPIMLACLNCLDINTNIRYETMQHGSQNVHLVHYLALMSDSAGLNAVLGNKYLDFNQKTYTGEYISEILIQKLGEIKFVKKIFANYLQQKLFKHWIDNEMTNAMSIFINKAQENNFEVNFNCNYGGKGMLEMLNNIDLSLQCFYAGYIPHSNELYQFNSEQLKKPNLSELASYAIQKLINIKADAQVVILCLESLQNLDGISSDQQHIFGTLNSVFQTYLPSREEYEDFIQLVVGGYCAKEIIEQQNIQQPEQQQLEQQDIQNNSIDLQQPKSSPIEMILSDSEDGLNNKEVIHQLGKNLDNSFEDI